MNYNVYISQKARADLDSIWEYICAELESPIAAMNTISRIIDDVQKLSTFPEGYPRLSSAVSVESDYRFLVSGNYIAFYRVTAPEVYIDRILYGKRDYLSILFGHTDFVQN